MRGRHFPRLCQSCDAPLARKDDACWRCHEAWVDHDDAAPALMSARTAFRTDAQHSPDAQSPRGGEVQAGDPSASDAEPVRETVQVS